MSPFIRTFTQVGKEAIMRSSTNNKLQLEVTEGGAPIFAIAPCSERPEVPSNCHVLVREMELEDIAA